MPERRAVAAFRIRAKQKPGPFEHRQSPIRSSWTRVPTHFALRGGGVYLVELHPHRLRSRVSCPRFALSSGRKAVRDLSGERYREAKHIYDEHSQPGFQHDDSPAALKALKDMWAASADEVTQLLSHNQGATAMDIDTALCNLESQTDCAPSSDGANVVKLAASLFLVAQSSEETGTVFVVGLRDGKPGLLWSINTAEPQQLDRRGLLAAWRVDRSGNACGKATGYNFARCGPLYAEVGLLTPTATGEPRFYIDAGYAQAAGATIGHQTSVWRWDGTIANLLWIDTHLVMIDQKTGNSFSDGVLTIGEKVEFRSFFSCGSCEGRQMLHRLRVTPSGIEDLGKTSTTPELDLIDELFWRLAHGKETSDIASPQVSHLLKPQIFESKALSKKIESDYFTTGMLGDVAITRGNSTKQLCFTVDGDIGRLYFTLKSTPGGQMTITHVVQPSGQFGDCPTTNR